MSEISEKSKVSNADASVDLESLQNGNPESMRAYSDVMVFETLAAKSKQYYWKRRYQISQDEKEN